jgi:exopolysaccharide biosynthesis polyprenyl glycosylphosphotransferase
MHVHMTLNRKEPFILLIGDLFFFALSLWLALGLRQLKVPTGDFFLTHLVPFTFLFVVWITVFYIGGLYEKHTMILQSKLPSVIFNVQLVNSALAITFFYLLPFLKITPKTILFIYLVISFLAVLFWRRYGYFSLVRGKAINAVLVGSGEEMKELLSEVNENPVYNISFVSSVDLDRSEGEIFWGEIIERIYAEDVSVIAIDLSNEKVEPVLPHLYNLIFSKVSFVDMHKIYEDIFDRVPLSLLKYNWFLENISNQPRISYDALKRVMDTILSLVLLILSVPVILLVAILIKLEDGGPVFIAQERIGKGNRQIRVYKLRTMRRNDTASTEWTTEGSNVVTRIGRFLRKTSIDELPQVWNILKGEMSFIGPRSDISGLGSRLAKEISYYNTRYLIKPGISGWAQVNQHYSPGNISPQSVEETKVRLAYDLYYVKNRSFLLDIKIALRTMGTLISRLSR